jgi:hypothetical protein
VKKWESAQTCGNSSPLKINCKPYHLIIMSTKLLISMLRKGANGQEILNILDVITGDSVTQETATESFAEPTLDEIAF